MVCTIQLRHTLEREICDKGHITLVAVIGNHTFLDVTLSCVQAAGNKVPWGVIQGPYMERKHKPNV